MSPRSVACSFPLAACLIAAIAVASFAPAALANGRFPAASQLVFNPLDNKHAAVRTTFGLLQTTDGTRFRWICEKALGYEGVYDPALALASGDRLLVALPDSVSRSVDRGCAWDRAGAPVAGEYVIDLAVDPTDPARVAAITALETAAPPGARAHLYLSNDGGATFAATRELPEDFRPQTVDFTRTAKKRIYASGLSPFARFAMFVRSDDDGVTWAESTFDIADSSGAYIAGVDPTNADRLYLRVDGASVDDLRFSADGGSSFTTILTGPQLLGFAISPDGKRVVAGGPGMGVHASGPEHSFTKVADHSVRCLAWTSDGLYACGSDPTDPFSIGRSRDGIEPFATVVRLADIEPLVCDPKTTTGSTCAAFWPEVSRTIKPPIDAGVDAAPVNDAAPDTPAVDADPPLPPSPGAASSSGCGCAIRGDRLSAAAAALAAAAAIALIRKRRTRP